jgi:hypothetical protein
MIEIVKFEQHEFQDDELVCYCFEYTRSDIEKDYVKNGHSTIMEKIASEKKAGRCHCAEKHPKGR